MKIKQISPHIWSLKTWMIIPIHVWAVRGKEGITLIDAGIPLMAKSILHSIEKLNAGALQRILLTHGHSDHTGSISAILKEKEIPVYAHSLEIPYLEGTLPYPRRKKAEVTVTPGITQSLATDIHGELETIDSLKPYHTPGHSPGHTVYYHEKDQILLAGDLFTSKKGKLKKPMPMFTADMQEAFRSSEIVAKLNPQQLEVCHGDSVLHPANQMNQYRLQFKN